VPCDMHTVALLLDVYVLSVLLLFKIRIDLLEGAVVFFFL
jgi:hypothetical protein